MSRTNVGWHPHGYMHARARFDATRRNVVALQSVVHLPRACVADSSVSRSKRDKMGGSCWGLMLELLPVGGPGPAVNNGKLHLHCAAAAAGGSGAPDMGMQPHLGLRCCQHLYPASTVQG